LRALARAPVRRLRRPGRRALDARGLYGGVSADRAGRDRSDARPQVSPRLRIAIFLPAVGIVAFLLFWSFAGLPDFGRYKGPYGFVLHRVATPERHMDNVVNAVTYDYRGFDTMGEAFILFAAVVGVVLLLRGRYGREAPI